jgi:hypothetical protein
MGSFVHNPLLEVQDAVDALDERGASEFSETLPQLSVLTDERAARASKVLAWIGIGATELDNRDHLRQECGTAAHHVADYVS